MSLRSSLIEDVIIFSRYFELTASKMILHFAVSLGYTLNKVYFQYRLLSISFTFSIVYFQYRLLSVSFTFNIVYFQYRLLSTLFTFNIVYFQYGFLSISFNFNIVYFLYQQTPKHLRTETEGYFEFLVGSSIV